MRVRVPNLLGNDVHPATMSTVEDELEPTGHKTLIEVRAEGKEPLHIDWSAADEVELVEATDEEKAAHAAMVEKQRSFD